MICFFQKQVPKIEIIHLKVRQFGNEFLKLLFLPKYEEKSFKYFWTVQKKNVRSFFGRIYGAPICFWFYRWLHKFILKLSNLQYSWLMLFYIFKRKATLDLQLLGNSGWLTESWDKFHFLCIFHPWGPNWLSGDARLFRAMWNQTHERCQ